MSVIGRTWTTVDDSISRLLEDYKQTTGVSYRDLAEKSGLKYSRLRDLINRVNGTPTVSEFITICQLRGEDPAEASAAYAPARTQGIRKAPAAITATGAPYRAKPGIINAKDTT